MDNNTVAILVIFAGFALISIGSGIIKKQRHAGQSIINGVILFSIGVIIFVVGWLYKYW